MVLWVMVIGATYCCHPTDSEEVEDIGADDVPHSDISIALDCGHEADDKLRRRGAESYDRETHDQRREPIRRAKVEAPSVR